MKTLILSILLACSTAGTAEANAASVGKAFCEKSGSNYLLRQTVERIDHNEYITEVVTIANFGAHRSECLAAAEALNR